MTEQEKKERDRTLGYVYEVQQLRYLRDLIRLVPYLFLSDGQAKPAHERGQDIWRFPICGFLRRCRSENWD